jgi:hypothetical protein
MGLDLYVLATLQKKLEVWFRTISDSAMIYITGDVGSGLYPVAHRVICYCGKIKYHNRATHRYQMEFLCHCSRGLYQPASFREPYRHSRT